MVLKNFAPFTNCIGEINNTQLDNATYLDVVMLMYNLIEQNDNFSNTSRSLCQFCRDSESFTLK